MARPPKLSDRPDETASQSRDPKGTDRPKLRRGRGNRLNTAADDAAEIARMQRDAEVLRLRSDGITFARIAEHLGISTTVAKVAYKRAVQDYGQESASEHKARANSRYDEQVGQLKAQRIAVQRLTTHKPSCRDGECGGCADERQAVAAHARLAAVQRTLALVTKQQAEMNGAVKQLVEHTGAGGGPIVLSGLDEVERLLAVGRENADGVQSVRTGEPVH